MEHCSDNGLLNLHMGKAILAAMQEYADQEVDKVINKVLIRDKRKEHYDFSNDEEYRHNSNC